MTARTVSELAALCDATLEGDGELLVVGPATLREAGPEHISFLSHARYAALLAETQAGAVLVGSDVERPHGELTLLRCEDPSRSFTAVIGAFARPTPGPAVGVHPTAFVEATAQIEDGASVGAQVSVGAGASIAAGVVIHPGVVIGAECCVGEQTVLHPGAVLYAGVQVGARCTIHGGTVIGSDGFGFEPTEAGWVKIPQSGTVVIEDDVEIGANCTVDRGRFGATRVGAGVKIDNQVHVGHNVVIGPGSLLVAQVGIAGSAVLGRGVVLAGKCGVNGHVVVGDGVRAAGLSMIYGDVEPGTEVFGNPARPRSSELRSMASTRRMPGQLRELAARVRALEEPEEEEKQS